MRKHRFLSSIAGAVVVGVMLAPNSASAQVAVVDWPGLAVSQAMKFIQNQMNNTLNSITNQLTATGPLGQILGSNQFGSVTALLQQGFTQISNYQNGYPLHAPSKS